MGTVRYPSGSAGATPSGAIVVTPGRPGDVALTRNGRITGAIGAFVNSPTAGNPGQTGGGQISGGGGLLGNPNYPCFAGAEILPLATTSVPVDLGTRYDFHHYLNQASIGTQNGTAASTFVNDYPGRQNHWVAYDLYPTGAELIEDEIVTYRLPIRRADLGAGAVTSAGTALAALQTPGGNYVILDATLGSCFVNTWFDASLLAFENPVSRVVRIGLRWLGWKDDSATAAPGEGISVLEYDTAVTPGGVGYGSWLIPDYEQSAQYQTRWLGESNYLSRGRPITPVHHRNPFTVLDLTYMSAPDERLFWQLMGEQGFDSSQTTTYLDFIEMIVEIVPERRIGVANRLVSNLSPTLDFGYDWTNTVSWAYPLDTQFAVQLTSTAYTLTVRESIPADTSDRYRADPTGPFRFVFMEALGPSLQMNGITQPRNTMFPQVDTDIATISDGVLVGQPQDFDEYNLATVHYDSADYLISGAFWAAYEGIGSPYAQSVSSFGGITVLLTVDGLTTFTRIKLLAKPDELTAGDLTVTISQFGVPLATATVAPATILALEPVGEDWREFELILSVPITPSSGQVSVALTSPATPQYPWFISAAFTLGRQQPFGYPNDGGPGIDYSIVLICEPTTPPDPDILPGTVELDASDASCGADEINYKTLIWDSQDTVTRYSIERSTDGGTTWTVVGIIENEASASQPLFPILRFDDLGAPWNIPYVYRLGAYRETDETITYGAASASQTNIAAGAVLGFSDLDGNTMIYAPTVESGSLGTTWTDMTPSDLVQLHGEDYSRALQAPEDRGLSFSQTILVKHLIPCVVPLDPDITVGQASLSPDPYALLLAMSKKLYLNVRFPDGDTRQMKLQLGSLQVRNQFGVFLAEVILTDVFVPNLDITQEAS